jgi:hypothetical protein
MQLFDDIPRETAGNLFRIDGEFWTIAFAGQVCRLRDTRGIRYVAHLLAHPTARIAAVELVAVTRSKSAAEPKGEDNSDRERARVTVTKGIKAALQRIREANGKLADHLDATIKRGYVCSYNPDPRVSIEWEGLRPPGNR